MRDGSHARTPLFPRVTGTTTSCDVTSSRGEAVWSENASEYGPGDAARQPVANTRAANAAHVVNRVIGESGNLVIDYQITRFPDHPIL